ncbi:hypothetical protein H5992_10690, partial [Limosilactobacillus reuteri]|nr:hypothetical protein [Limosilactobacillus reuteri]
KRQRLGQTHQPRVVITQRPVQRQVGKHQPRRTVVQRVKRQRPGRTRR